MNPEQQDLTPWDRRVIRAIGASAMARRGAQLLRVAAGVIAVAAVVGAWLTTWSQSAFANEPTKLRVGQFIESVVGALALAGLLAAASLMVDLYASRLDLNIVNTDEDETSDNEEPLPPPS